jgi:hypothetical protein
MPYQQQLNFSGAPIPVSPISGFLEGMNDVQKRQMDERKAEQDRQRDIFLNQLTQAQTKNLEAETENLPEKRELEKRWKESQIKRNLKEEGGKPTELARTIEEYKELQKRQSLINDYNVDPDTGKPYIDENKKQKDLEDISMYSGGYQSKIGGPTGRSTSALAKQEKELSDIKEGFIPGTNRSKQFKDEKSKQEALSRYNEKRIKDITDPVARQKVRVSTNIEKTIDKIDFDKVAAYSGLPGRGELSLEKAKDLFGMSSKQYKDYMSSINGIHLLKDQIRQFYGGSVQEPAVQEIYKMLDTTDWKRSPETARAMMGEILGILNSEVATYREPMEVLYKGKQAPLSAEQALEQQTPGINGEQKHPSKMTIEEIRAELGR